MSPSFVRLVNGVLPREGSTTWLNSVGRERR